MVVTLEYPYFENVHTKQHTCFMACACFFLLEGVYCMPLSGISPSSMVYHVYQMKIEFSINLVQSHTKPTPHGVG